MGESNGEWGKLAEHDNELADVWDGLARLPEPGTNEALDAFVESKHLTIGSLVRLGARMADDFVIAYAGAAGIKYRDIVSGRPWSYEGSEWNEMKRVPLGAETDIAIIAEGETDGARLSDGYPADVFIMQAGAGTFTDRYAAQVIGYKRVLVGLDTDNAGTKGSATIMKLVPHAERFLPPDGATDWCEADELPVIPDEAPHDPATQYMVSAGDLLSIEPPEQESYFEDALLPVAGQLVLHGWAKSFKSFLALDLLAALSQGSDWATFASTTGPVRVAVGQFEIPWPYYRQRIAALRQAAQFPELFDENFLTITPLRRPPLVAGDVKQEDELIRQLLDNGVEIMLIDPIRRALGSVNLNATEDVRPLLAFAQRIQDNGIAVVMCHHDNKASSRAGGGDPLGMTGAGDFAGDCDSIVSVGVPKGLTLREPKRNLFFTLRNAPSPSPRGFEMTEQGHIRYSQEPFGDGMADDTEHGPSI